MLKKFAMLTLAFGAASSAAFAADLPTKKAPPVIPPPPLFSWTGFYFGANVGYGWGNASDSEVPGPTPATFGANPFSVGIDPTGALGGVQAGYNWQTGGFVIGAETDLDLAGISHTGQLNGLPNSAGVINPAWLATASEDVQAFGTLRLRAGVAIDRALIYATGGLAYGDVKYSSYTQYTAASAFEYAGSDSTWKAGWTLGAGLEYAVTNNWTVKGEYLYYDLGNKSYAAPPLAANPPYFVGQSFSTTGNIVRVGVNYKF